METSGMFKSILSFIISMLLTIYAYLDVLCGWLKFISLLLTVITGGLILVYWLYKIKKERNEAEISAKVNDNFNDINIK